MDHDNIQRSKLPCDTRKCMLSCVMPKRYGAKIDLDIDQKIGSDPAGSVKDVLRDPLEPSITSWGRASREKLEANAAPVPPPQQPIRPPRAKKSNEA